MPKIAISYRRADSEAMTGRIFDRLIAHYGKDAIFRDIDDIPPGIDFRVHINQTLLKTHILLSIVGPQWLGMASDGSADRIQEESDPVRVEVETALPSEAMPSHCGPTIARRIWVLSRVWLIWTRKSMPGGISSISRKIASLP
jgi:hypothetical protein